MSETWHGSWWAYTANFRPVEWVPRAGHLPVTAGGGYLASTAK